MTKYTEQEVRDWAKNRHYHAGLPTKTAEMLNAYADLLAAQPVAADPTFHGTPAATIAFPSRRSIIRAVVDEFGLNYDESEAACAAAFSTKGPAQPVAVPDANKVDEAAKKLADRFDYPWEFMPGEGKDGLRNLARDIAAMLASPAAEGLARRVSVDAEALQDVPLEIQQALSKVDMFDLYEESPAAEGAKVAQPAEVLSDEQIDAFLPQEPSEAMYCCSDAKVIYAEDYRTAVRSALKEAATSRHAFTQIDAAVLLDLAEPLRPLLKDSGDWGLVLEYARSVIKRAVLTQPSGGDSPERFKGFHRSLCERFGYPHDDQFWWRDLVSLEEHIAALAQQQGRDAEIMAFERDVAAAGADRLREILVSIYGLLNPPVVQHNGLQYQFNNPDANSQLQALSDKIRKIPDEIAAIAASTKGGAA